MPPALALREVLRTAADTLAGAGVPSPRVDAEQLAAHVLGIERSRLALVGDISAESATELWVLVERRAGREPLQHLTGRTGFRYLDLQVRPGVFVPRPETEMVAEIAIEAALARARARTTEEAGTTGTGTDPATSSGLGPVTVVDLCTGAGGIACALAQEVPTARVWALDFSAEAVDLATANAAEHGLSNLTVFRGDVTDPATLEPLAHLTGTLDVLVSNPPYIPFDAEPVDPEVRDFDPPAALYGGGEDGLAIPAAVIARARDLLASGGILVVEHGDEQGPAMRDLVAAHGGFEDIHTQTDLTGRDRMVVATRAEVAN